MGREKKITVKPFLNTLLNPRFETAGGDPMYPLYFQVTYDRRTTRFKAGENYLSLSEQVEFDDDRVLQKAIKAVQQIVQLEASRNVDFQLTEIGGRVRCYCTKVIDGAHLLYDDLMRDFLNDRLTARQYSEWQLLSNQERRKYLKNNFSEDLPSHLFLVESFLAQMESKIPYTSSIYDWLIGGGRESFSTIDKAKSELVTKISWDIIDRGLDFTPDTKSGTYKELGRVFNIEIGG